MTRVLITAALSLALLGAATPSQAQHRRNGSGSSGGTAAPRSSGGTATPRGSGGGTVVVAPRVSGGYYGRPYYYGSRFSLGFYAGYPYYYPYYSPYSYSGGYYGYPYAGDYAYGPYGGYAVGVGSAYGGVRIMDAPREAPVYADGYYVGTVNDFDGVFQHLDLEPGTHHVEIRTKGEPAIAFDVNIRPGENITYHAR